MERVAANGGLGERVGMDGIHGFQKRGDSGNMRLIILKPFSINYSYSLISLMLLTSN